MPVPLGELALRYGCRLIGDPEQLVFRVATLAAAGPEDLAFLANPQYRRQLTQSAAGAVVLAEEDAGECPGAALIHDNPYAAYARIASELHPPPPARRGIHEAATVSPSATLGEGVSVGPSAVVEARVRIGERTVIGPGAVLGEGAVVGSDCRIGANVTLCHGVRIGRRVIVHPGAVIGADGFGIAREPDGWIKVPQVGGVRVGDDVEIGASTTIDRGAIEDTVVENGVKLDNQIQIAHNVVIGEHTVMAACSGVSGSTRIGKRCMIAGAVGNVGHLEICEDVVITGQTRVSRSLTQPGVYSSALPADAAARWRRNSARFRQLDDMAKRLRRLERAVGETAEDTPQGETDE